jgi:hypothetical protein
MGSFSVWGSLTLLAMGRGSSERSSPETIEPPVGPSSARKILESEVHHHLADLGLPLYMTTNFDNFMSLGLKARGRDPRRESVPWSQLLHKDPGRSTYDLNPPATPEEPVVLHLFGLDDDPFSMVLTEDDYLDYLAVLSREFEYLLPVSVQARLASTTCFSRLQAGRSGPEGDLAAAQEPGPGATGCCVAVQIEASIVDQAMHEEVIFQAYFSQSHPCLLGSAQQFVTICTPAGRSSTVADRLRSLCRPFPSGRRTVGTLGETRRSANHLLVIAYRVVLSTPSRGWKTSCPGRASSGAEGARKIDSTHQRVTGDLPRPGPGSVRNIFVFNALARILDSQYGPAELAG